MSALSQIIDDMRYFQKYHKWRSLPLGGRYEDKTLYEIYKSMSSEQMFLLHFMIGETIIKYEREIAELNRQKKTKESSC